MKRFARLTCVALTVATPIAANAAPSDIYHPRQFIEIQLPVPGPGPVISDVVTPSIVLR